MNVNKDLLIEKLLNVELFKELFIVESKKKEIAKAKKESNLQENNFEIEI